MITIYKYSVAPNIDRPNVIQMPQGATVISCGLDGFGVRSIWALVDTDKTMEERRIWRVGTGWDLKEMFNGLCPQIGFIGTIQDEYYIWHVFEEPSDGRELNDIKC
jgi:hypothetical protein